MPTMMEVFSLAFVAGIGFLTAQMVWVLFFGTINNIVRLRKERQQ